MFYYTVIQTLKDGTQPMSTTGRPSMDDAVQQMYYDMWYAMNSENIDSIMCIILNDIGNTERKESWSRPLPPPNTESTED